MRVGVKNVASLALGSTILAFLYRGVCFLIIPFCSMGSHKCSFFVLGVSKMHFSSPFLH